jgi:hypothetical protein
MPESGDYDAGPTCGECGSAMRQTYIFLTLSTGCQRIPDVLRCTNQECEDRQREQDRADAEARSEAAMQRAIERGVILP